MYKGRTMSTIELRNDFHELIDRIKNKAILEKFYYLMDNADKSSSRSLLDNLSEQERQDLLQADAESNVKSNLISHEEMKKKHDRWL